MNNYYYIVCRPADGDERRKLEAAGYSADDAAEAVALARDNDGRALYRIDAENYAVEGSTGEIVAELTAKEAFAEWFC